MPVSIEHELDVLERKVSDLRVEFERFFSGVLKLPPNKVKQTVQEQLRKLSNLEVDKAAERFRLQALQSRFNSLSDLWERKIQAREEGKSLATLHMRSGVPDEPTPQAGVRKVAEKRDEKPPSDVKPRKVDFRPLFEKYIAAKQAAGEDVSRIRYERFEELVRKQAEDIRNKTGATRLVFEIKSDEGRVRLIGRPSQPKGGA